jgi:hypothetical protein
MNDLYSNIIDNIKLDYFKSSSTKDNDFVRSSNCYLYTLLLLFKQIDALNDGRTLSLEKQITELILKTV